MKSSRKNWLKRGLLTVLTLGLVLGPASAGGPLLTVRAAEEFYSHTFTQVAKQGDNICGDLTWNFSMAATGNVEGSRGMRFLVADSDTQELVVKTTVADTEISQIQLEAAMSANGDTTFSISIGGKDIVRDQAVTNVNNLYTFNTGGASGEIVIRMKATVPGKTSCLKSITLLTREVEEPGMRVNYHTHTYRCNHAGTAQDREYVEAYVDSSIAALETGLFSVFAHPDYFMSTVTFWNDNIADDVRRMCETAKEMGVAMEINEGCFNNETKRQMGDEYRYRYPYDKFWEIVKEVGNTVVLGVDAHDPSAYNESARKMAMDFADELGLTVTEGLGITVKTPNPDAPIYSAPGVTEPTTGTGTAPTSVAEPSEVYADLLDFDMDSVEFREINGSTVTLEMVDGSLIVGNTGGAWPNAIIEYGEGIAVNVNDTLIYDLETKDGMETSIRLNFLDKDETPRQVILNQGMVADTSPDSGDLRTNQTVKGAMRLGELAEGGIVQGGHYPGQLLGEYADAAGYITVASMEVYAAGPATGSVVINRLEIGTPDEVEEPSGTGSSGTAAGETTTTADSGAAAPSGSGTEETGTAHGTTAGTGGQAPATGEAGLAGGAALLLLFSAALLAAARGKGFSARTNIRR